ncbi:MAG: hypothetical protein H7067_03860, partial [Burkholderiales bacterium]|nr:hypothetical protein [Opitutaceae bacterium]
MGNPVGMRITNPVEQVTDDPARRMAYQNLPGDGLDQTCKITGHFINCPDKYKIILSYWQVPRGGGEATLRTAEKDYDFTDQEMPRTGWEVEMELPTSECFFSVFENLEYVPESTCSTPSPRGSGPTSNKSISSVVSLGKATDGSSAGFLYMHLPGVQPEAFLPQAWTLVRGKRPEDLVVVRYPADGPIRQILTPEALVDITALVYASEDYGTLVRFYPRPLLPQVPDPATGLYAIASGATVLASVRYEHPDYLTTPLFDANRLRVTRQLGTALSEICEFEQSTPSAPLSFIEGGGLRRIVRTRTSSGSTQTNREEHFSPATPTVPDHVAETVTTEFPFGSVVVEKSVGTGAARRWATYHYDTDAESPSYGLLLSKLSSDGSWERFAYHELTRELLFTYSPLADAPPQEVSNTQLRRVETRPTRLDPPLLLPFGPGTLTTTIEQHGGVEVGRSHRFQRDEPGTLTFQGDSLRLRHLIETRAARPGDAWAWNDPANPTTHRFSQLVGARDTDFSLTLDSSGDATFEIKRFDFLTGDKLLETWQGPANLAVTASTLPNNILAGTRTRERRSPDGRVLSRETYDVGTETAGTPYTGRRLDSLIYDNHDSLNRPRLVVHLDGSEETREYNPCCGQLSSVTHCGITTTYGYDALGRREWEKVEAGSGGTLQTISHTRFTHDSSGRILTRFRIPTSGPEQLTERNTYDDAGTLLSTASPGSLATDPTLTRVTTHVSTYDSGTGRTTRTVTLPGGATQITVTDRAGRTLSRTGTAVAPVRYEYGTATLADAAQWGLPTTAPLPFTREIKLSAAGADTAELVTTYSDFLGRTIKTVYPGTPEVADRSFYDTAGRLVRQTDPDDVQTLYAFTPATATTGEVQVSALDIDRNGIIDFAGSDRITRQTSLIATRSGYTVQRTTTEVWETAPDEPTTVSTTETTPDGLRSWQTAHITILSGNPETPTPATLTTASVTTCNDTTGERTTTVTLPDTTSQVRVTVGGRQVSDTRKNSAGTTVTQTTYGYDAHGRLSSQVSGFSPQPSLTTYYADDRPHTVTTPDPDANPAPVTGYNPQTTTYTYHVAGQVDTVTQPDATQTFTTYWPTGQVKRTWGSRTYPSEYAYDAQGRLKTLTTWQNFATSAGAAVTTWNYSTSRGWLENKRYADDKGPSFTYTPAGRLETRTWARTFGGSPLVTTYDYTESGDMESIIYSDTTPSVTHTYDRLGRIETTTDAAGLLTRTYQNSRLDDETYSTATGTLNLLAGLAVTRTQGTYNRPATLGATSLTSVTYGYDTAGRLGTLTQGTRVATLGYKPLVGTHQSTAITVSGTARAATTRTTDALGRIGRVDTTSGATLHASRSYTYDDANQRTEVVHEDNLRWNYGYDDLGQVTSARKRNASAALLPGYDHAYAYDTIGNRVSTTTNGRLATYAPDLRNQYVSRIVPGAVDVLGSVPPYNPVPGLSPTGANVVVAGENPARSGDLFYRAVPVNNATAAVFESIAVIAARPVTPAQLAANPSAKDQVATETRSAFVARTPESYAYDLDGNLKQDGRWNYTWDGENRLVALETRPDVVAQAPALPRQKLHFAYDAQGRRIRKETFAWSGTAWTPLAQTKFLYDDWNLLAEYNGFASNAVVRSHVWGLDLSGGEQGAGGVGGLLWTSTSTVTHAPGWDANGNIIAWIDLANGTVAGRRDYGAFGEPLLATGNAASLPFAFSTKYRDSEAELYYYGFRYYNPSTGRWLSRDPIEERGGLNLYGMVGNNPIGWIDILGLAGEACFPCKTPGAKK